MGLWMYDNNSSWRKIHNTSPEHIVCGDLDNNGQAEVLFTSWVQKGSNQTGKLYIVDHNGNEVFAVDLPPAYGSPDWNGALPAPTLANIDEDADLEVVINTAHSGFVAYDLPDTAQF